MDFQFPKIENKTIALKVSKHAERSIKQNHPWLFENSIIKQNQEGTYGDIAIIYNHKSNKLIAIGLYDPDSPIRVKLLSFGGPLKIDESHFRTTIESAYQKRKPLLPHTNAFRLIYGENDYLPGLIIDIYNSIAVIKSYSRIWIPYLQDITNAVTSTLELDCVVLRLSRNVSKQRLPDSIKEGVTIFGNLQNENISINEYGVHFIINILKGHKTGFFLDHRQNRRMIGELSKGKSVLDVFCYAGGFSAHAVKGGATKVTSVDISPQAIDLAQGNVERNGKATEHETLCGDAFELLDKLNAQNQLYDLIIIDPPSFAKSEKEKPNALKHYQRLAYLSTRLVKHNGTILLASCSSRISIEEFKSANQAGFKMSNKQFTIIEETGHDIDHPTVIPESTYLKSVYYTLKH